MTIKMIIFSCVISMIFSCSPKEENYINYKELIKHISNEDPNSFSIFSRIYLFCEIDEKEKKYQLLDSSVLLKAHYGFYQNISYKDFVLRVFSGQLIIDCKEAYECFYLNNSVTKEYKNNSFSTFVRKYSESYEDETYILKRDLALNVRLTIMYYSYLNGYYTTYDDVAGYYFCERINSVSAYKTDQEESVL